MKYIKILLFFTCILQIDVQGMITNWDNNQQKIPNNSFKSKKLPLNLKAWSIEMEEEEKNEYIINNVSPLPIPETNHIPNGLPREKNTQIAFPINLPIIPIQNPSNTNLQTKFQPKHKIFSYYRPRFSKIYVNECLLKRGRHICSNNCTKFKNNLITGLCGLKDEIEKPLGRSLNQKDISNLYKLSVYIIGIVQPQIENEMDSICKQIIRTKENGHTKALQENNNKWTDLLKQKKTKYKTDLEKIEVEKSILQQKITQHEKTLQENEIIFQKTENKYKETLEQKENEYKKNSQENEITLQKAKDEYEEVLREKEAKLDKLLQQISTDSEQTKTDYEAALQECKQELEQTKAAHKIKWEMVFGPLNDNMEQLQIEKEAEHKKALDEKDKLLRKQEERFTQKPRWFYQRYPRLTSFAFGLFTCHFTLNPTPYICGGLRVLSFILRGFAYFAPKKKA